MNLIIVDKQSLKILQFWIFIAFKYCIFFYTSQMYILKFAIWFFQTNKIKVEISFKIDTLKEELLIIFPI